MRRTPDASNNIRSNFVQLVSFSYDVAFGNAMVGSCVHCGGRGCAVQTINKSYIEVSPPVKELKVTNMISGTVDLKRVFKDPVKLQFHTIGTMLSHIPKNEDFKGVMSFVQGDEFKHEKDWVLTDSNGSAEVKYAKHVLGPTLLSRKTDSDEEAEIWTCRNCMHVKNEDDKMLAQGIRDSLQTFNQRSTGDPGHDEAADIALAIELSLA